MATLDLTFTPRALPGPAPVLAAHSAHIWRVDLGRPRAARANVLSPDERARADRMRHAGARRAFEEARTAARLILAAYTGEDAALLPIVIDPRGKPELDLPDAPRFNLSHSDTLALVAVTSAASIGVDVEMLRPTPRLEDLAARFFAPRETAALRALPPAERLEAFFACWTRKEAYVKAQGSGIADALAAFEVSLAPGEPARLLSMRDDDSVPSRTTLHAFRPAADSWGAVCILAPAIEVSGFDLTG